MGNTTRRDYQTDPLKFDRWVNANAAFGFILAIGILAMALAGLNSAARLDGTTELSSVTASK
jgi:hypothetical protein